MVIFLQLIGTFVRRGHFPLGVVGDRKTLMAIDPWAPGATGVPGVGAGVGVMIGEFVRRLIEFRAIIFFAVRHLGSKNFWKLKT